MKKSKQHVQFSLLILCFSYGITMAEDSPCGDWEPYKNEKCFKIIDETLRRYDDAEKVCNQQQNSATLVTIHSMHEQHFLSNLLFKTHHVLDNVWIGVKYTINKFKYIDGSDLSFTNWAERSPQNYTCYDCVQMTQDASSMGKWINEPCGRKNLVVCQKMQTWSISRLQKILLDARKELQDSLENVTKQLNNQQSIIDIQQITINSHESTINSQRSTIKSLKQNPVPIGFIYVQFPSQPEPMILWSTVNWTDVTSNYSGLFFRAEGGGSAKFGSVQEENSPRLAKIEYVEHVPNQYWSANISSGIKSDYIRTGVDSVRAGLSFYVSPGEVRPRNKAMRIWKRTK